MNIKNPVHPVLSNPKGVDINIEKLRVKLTDNLSWLERSFGRAVALYEKKDSIIRVPKVPLGKGEYFSCMPNDTQKAFSFFYPVGPLESLGENESYSVQRFFKQRVDLYVWANLRRIDETNLGLGELLKSEVIELLNRQPNVIVHKVWSDDVNEVYRDWKIDPVARDILYWPFYAIRFELELNVLQNDC